MTSPSLHPRADRTRAAARRTAPLARLREALAGVIEAIDRFLSPGGTAGLQPIPIRVTAGRRPGQPPVDRTRPPYGAPR